MSATAEFYFGNPKAEKSSETIFTIAGISVHVYGLDELTKPGGRLAVLYMAHGRTRTYTDSELIFYDVLEQYRKHKKDTELIGVAFDCRNHGSREVDAFREKSWPENPTHAVDMLSDVIGTAQDFVTVAEFLPAYLPKYSSFYNIMSGISLGGHTVWRVANIAPELFQAYLPIIGCPALSGLLPARLQIELPKEIADSNEPVAPPVIEKYATAQQKEYWPIPAAKLAYLNDVGIDKIDVSDKHFLILNGELDPLVLNKYTLPWVKSHKSDRVQFHAQDNAGHQLSPEMIEKINKWLLEVIGESAKL